MILIYTHGHHLRNQIFSHAQGRVLVSSATKTRRQSRPKRTKISHRARTLLRILGNRQFLHVIIPSHVYTLRHTLTTKKIPCQLSHSNQ